MYEIWLVKINLYYFTKITRFFIFFSGGLSNYLYLCSLPDDYQLENGEPRHVLVRLYGEIMVKNTEFIVNDSVVFALLSEKQLGPKLYGVFQGGRVEEYIKVCTGSFNA